MLNPRYTFAEFVIGRSNDVAVAAAAAVAAAPGRTYNPLFLYGATGLGKTHLMHGVAHAALEHRTHARVVYVTGEGFVSDLVQAIQAGGMAAFRERYHGANLLLVDDLHTLAGHREAQEAFADAAADLFGAGHQVVVTSDRPPEAVEVPRHAPRFRLGKVADISLPAAEHRTRILRAKVRAGGLEASVGNDVIQLLAGAIRSNTRVLEGALVRVVAYGRLRGRPVTPRLAAEALRIDFGKPTALRRGAARVQDVVAAEWGVTPEALISKRRSRELLEPRQVAMYLCREMLGMTLGAIGEAFGGRDHSTVVNALDRLDATLGATPAMAERIEHARQLIEQAETPPPYSASPTRPPSMSAGPLAP